MKRTFYVGVIMACMLCLFSAFTGCGSGDSGVGGDGSGGDATVYRTVVFDSRGGSSVQSRLVPDGGRVARPETPEKDDCVFLGWYRDEKTTSEWNFDADTVSGDMTLYAGWRAGEPLPEPEPDPDTPDGERKILIAYFSCTETTRGVAEAIHGQIEGSDIYRIVPAVAYTSADLNYNNSSSRANREQNDPTARPAINGSVDNIEKYDVIFIGYPIWHGQAPKIIYTFLESYDYGFDGVTMIPFCTSGSSGIGTSATNLHGSAPDADWKSGARISGNNVGALIEQMDRV